VENKNYNSNAALSPIAHIMLEDDLVQEEEQVKITEIQEVENPSITINSDHKKSEFIVSFKQTQAPQTKIQKTTEKAATMQTPEPKQTTTLSFSHELAVKQTITQKKTKLPVIKFYKSAKRKSSLHKITDILAVEDIVNELKLEARTEKTQILAKEITETTKIQPAIKPEQITNQEDEAPLITLEELTETVFSQNQETESQEAELLTFQDLIDSIESEKPENTEDTKYIQKTFATKPKETQTLPQKQKIKIPFISARSFQVGWTKALASFVLLSFTVVLPIHAVSTARNLERSQGDILSMSMEALSSMKNATGAVLEKDFTKATSSFDSAASSFQNAQKELSDANKSLLGIADLLPNTGKEIKQARLLLKSGQNLSNAASILSDGMFTVSNRTSKSPTSAISLFDVFIEEALPELEEANNSLSKIDLSALPADNRLTVKRIASGVKSIYASFSTFHKNSEEIQNILGENKRQRYLVVFQNNTELRPTGGFWGSFAEIDILNGEIEKITIPGGGIYDMQGQLTEKVEAPKPLQLINGRWELQDANWFPDFPTTAKKAMWFYEQSGGPSVDGVITINATLVADLIAETGPIELPNYNMTIDSENFLFKTQKQVELDYNKKENKPKAFIGDLAPLLLEKMMNSDQETFMGIADILSEGLAEQDIQIYHQDPDIQNALHELGWDGAILGNTGDYLMVTHTNIGGGKTDGVIDDKIEIDSTMRGDGRIENVVKITRTHHGLKTSTFSGANNVSFTRIFVPRGSELLSVQGANPPEDYLFDSTEGLTTDKYLQRVETSKIDEGSGATISESLGKTSFGHWMQTKPGTENTLTFRYLLPKDILDEPKESIINTAAKAIGVPQTTKHSILIQKQPGVENRTTTYNFDPGARYSTMWSTSKTLKSMTLENNTNSFFGMILEQR